jgi:hypothetical protein
MRTASLTLIFTICAAMFCMRLDAAEPGRTDGPEGTELGRGGYPFGGPEGRFYISPAFGSGIFDRNADSSRTGLLYSLNLGYERDGWLAIEGGYAYLSDRKLSIYSLGSRFDYNADPFVYYFSAQAGLYKPTEGESNFGLAPGAGIDIILNDRIRVGLNYKRDFIFTDGNTTDVDRLFAGLKFYF